MQKFLLVAFGGGLGSVLRYGVGLLVKPAPGNAFPTSTFLVNLAGSFVIGLLAGLAARGGWIREDGWLLLATGLCGGFTTFSAFSLEGVRMLQSGHLLFAVLYLGGSVLLGLALCALGLRLTA